VWSHDDALVSLKGVAASMRQSLEVAKLLCGYKAKRRSGAIAYKSDQSSRGLTRLQRCRGQQTVLVARGIK
jgi:hypothetical protein